MVVRRGADKSTAAVAINVRGKEPDRVPAWYIVPTVLMFAVFTAAPLVLNIVLSLTRFSIMIAPTPAWTGLSNYRAMLQDPVVWTTLRTLVLYIVIPVPVELILGMALALLLQVDLPGFRRSRAVYILPMVIPPVVVGLMWNMLLTPQMGGFDNLLVALGFPAIAWLTHATTAIAGVMLATIWEYTPFTAILFMGAIDSLPQEPYEAARIDGASWWKTVWGVTIPQIIPTVIVATIFQVIGTLNIFATIYSMTGGGPGRATEPLNFYAFDQAFKYFNLGYGTALAVLLFALMIGFAIVFIRWGNRAVREGAS